MSIYSVIQDNEGFWLMQDKPEPTDNIIHQGTDLFEAEQVLCRYTQASE